MTTLSRSLRQHLQGEGYWRSWRDGVNAELPNKMRNVEGSNLFNLNRVFRSKGRLKKFSYGDFYYKLNLRDLRSLLTIDLLGSIHLAELLGKCFGPSRKGFIFNPGQVLS